MTSLYEEIFKLKNILRKGWVVRNAWQPNGRCESDAEHCFSMAMLALEIMEKRKYELDKLKVLKLIIYHELCEIDTGDWTPLDKIPANVKYENEYVASRRLAVEYDMPEILECFVEFEEKKTPEAIFAKKMDKLDCLMQCKIYSKINNNPKLFEEFADNAPQIVSEFKEFLDKI